MPPPVIEGQLSIVIVPVDGSLVGISTSTSVSIQTGLSSNICNPRAVIVVPGVGYSFDLYKAEKGAIVILK